MSTATRAQQAKSGSDGFIIVAVLWILAALATLVSVYAIYVTNSAIAVAASGDATIADPLVAAGVEPRDLKAIFVTSVTGIAAPSLDGSRWVEAPHGFLSLKGLPPWETNCT